MTLIFNRVLIQSSQNRKEQKLNDQDFNDRRITTGALLTISHQQELITKENLGLE